MASQAFEADVFVGKGVPIVSLHSFIPVDLKGFIHF